MPEESTVRMNAAYELLLPKLRAIPADRVVKPKVDLQAAAGLVIAALPKLAPYKAALGALPNTSKELVDELEDRAYAMVRAITDARAVLKETLPLPALLERGEIVRTLLLASADILVVYGDIPASFVADVRANSGHLDLASDLLVLGRMLTREWAKAENRTPAKKELVEEALRLGEQLTIALGNKAQPGEASEVVQLRDRAYTLFLEAYNEVRTGLAYLRAKEGDAEKTFPSVFAGNRRGSRGGEEEQPAPGPGPGPLSPQAETRAGSEEGTEPGGPFAASDPSKK